MYTFVIPDPTQFPSGGNIYNQHLLKALGEQARWLSWEQLQPSIAHTHCLFDTLYLAHLQNATFDLQNHTLIVHHLHSLDLPEPAATTYFLSQEKPILERFGGFLTSSTFTATYLQQRGLDRAFKLVLPPALTIPVEWSPRDSTSLRALVIANLIPRKGIIELLQGLKIAQPDRTRFQLQIVGSMGLDTNYATACQRLVESDVYLRQVVHFAGALSPKEVQESYRNTNVLVSPAFMETFGMAIQEARAFGLPILAYDGGNAGFHVEKEQNGLLFQDHRSLAEQLRDWSVDLPDFQKYLARAERLAQAAPVSNWTTRAQYFLEQMQNYVGNRI